MVKGRATALRRKRILGAFFRLLLKSAISLEKATLSMQSSGDTCHLEGDVTWEFPIAFGNLSSNLTYLERTP